MIPRPLPLAESFIADAAEEDPRAPVFGERPNIAVHRREDCAAYPFCLQRAAAENWPGFSCAECCPTRVLQFLDLDPREIQRRPALWSRRPGPLVEGGALWDAAVRHALCALYRGREAPPLLVVSPQGERHPGDPRPRRRRGLYNGRAWLEAALRLGLDSVQCAEVGRASCPWCGRQEALIAEPEGYVNRRGTCTTCYRGVLARGAGVVLVKVRDWELEEEAAAARRELAPEPATPAFLGGVTLAAAGLAVAVQQLLPWG